MGVASTMSAAPVVGVAARRRRNLGDEHAPLSRSFLARQRAVLADALADEALAREVRVLEHVVAAAPSPADIAVFDCAAARIRARSGARELAAIHRALRRILTGDYGRCSVCSRAIPAERLRRIAGGGVDLCAVCESARSFARATPTRETGGTPRRCGVRATRGAARTRRS
jgi:RNA polymerase-binding transcription factor DksA